MRDEAWKKEAAFFDLEAERRRHEVGQTDPLTLARYGTPFPRRRFAREFRFGIIGSPRGRTIIDVGCGEGQDTVLLAQLGAARVVGLDCSPKAIELARARARVNGVEDRVDFVCAAAETADLPPRSFDVVWCNAILHHLTHVLDQVMASMVKWVKPDGLLTFAEPTALSPGLRRLRKLVPVAAGETTEDERPLEPADLEVLRKHVPDLQLRHFSMLGRLDQFVLRTIPPGSTLPQFNYERASTVRKAVVNTTAIADWFLLSLPGVDRFGSASVMWGHGRPAAMTVTAAGSAPTATGGIGG